MAAGAASNLIWGNGMIRDKFNKFDMFDKFETFDKFDSFDSSHKFNRFDRSAPNAASNMRTAQPPENVCLLKMY